MGFPTRLLNDGEDVIADLRPHWSTMFWPCVVLVAGIVAAVGLQGAPTFVAYLLAVGLVASMVWLVLRYARWATTSFTLTTDRVVVRSGVLSRRGREMPLERLNDISYHQTLIQRILGCGDIILESAGERGQEAFPRIPRPAKVQNLIYREIERSQQRQADRMSGSQPLSIPDQIDKLDQLRQRGVLSAAEFEAKKAQLLDRL